MDAASQLKWSKIKPRNLETNDRTGSRCRGEKYRTMLKRRIAFANLRLAVFIPTVHVFHKEGVAVIRRGILRQNLGVSLARLNHHLPPPTFMESAYQGETLHVLSSYHLCGSSEV